MLPGYVHVQLQTSILASPVYSRDRKISILGKLNFAVSLTAVVVRVKFDYRERERTRESLQSVNGDGETVIIAGDHFEFKMKRKCPFLVHIIWN